MMDFLSGLLIILFIGFVIVLLGCMRAIAQRSKFLEQMKSVQKSLRDLLSGMHALRVNLRQNQVLKNEPFLSKVKTLDIELSWLELEFNTLRNQYIEVQEKIDYWEKMDRINYVFTLLPGSVYNQLIPTTNSFLPQIAVLKEYLSAAVTHTREIAELGWEVACQLREMLEKLKDCKRVFQALYEKNVRGSAFDEVERAIEELSRKISDFPQELMANSREEIVEQTEYATICEAYNLYQEIEPVVDSLHLRLYQWWNDYQQAARTIDTAQSTLSNTQDLIQESSQRIALGNLQENFKTIQSIGYILNDTLNRVEVESLPEMTQEADRIYQLASDATNTVQQARRNQSILEPLLEQTEESMTQIDELVSSLSKHSIFPIAWDVSADLIYSFKQRKKDILVEERLRSPDEIQNHLAIAIGLYKEITALLSRIKRVVTIHESLVEFYQTEEINQGLYWHQEAKRIIEAAQTYNQANFPKNLSIQSLASELEENLLNHQSLLNRLFPNPICESHLSSLLEEMRILFDSYRILEEQITEVKSYLTIFREEINQTRQSLHKIQPYISQLESIVHSNPLFLQQGGEKEIERLRKNLNTVTTKVNSLSTGTLHDKQNAVSIIDRRVEMACNRWMILMNKNIDMVSDNLREQLRKLCGMANLDDAVIQRAHRLINRVNTTSGKEQPNDGKTIRYENPVLLLKGKNDLYQNLIAVFNEIEETIFNPVNDAYQAVLTHKERAMKELLEATAHIPEKRSWPATTVSFTDLSTDLSTIDAAWEKNISQPMRAIWWVKRFGEISLKYQEFTHSVIVAMERYEDERQTIIELEQQLDTIDQKWTALEHRMINDHATAMRIRALKKDIEQQYKQIKRRWQLSSGVSEKSISYEEIKGLFAELVERFNLAMVFVDDANGKVMGVDGQIREVNE